MSQLLSVELPEDVYERVRRAAKATNQPVEQALAAIVRGATPSLDKVPPQYRAELEAMEILGDDELGDTAQASLTAAKQRRLADLLHKKQQGALTNRQESVLAELQSEADRVMLRRAQSAHPTASARANRRRGRVRLRLLSRAHRGLPPNCQVWRDLVAKASERR